MVEIPLFASLAGLGLASADTSFRVEFKSRMAVSWHTHALASMIVKILSIGITSFKRFVDAFAPACGVPKLFVLGRRTAKICRALATALRKIKVALLGTTVT